MKSTKFKLTNLTCQACVKICRMKIRKIEGVSEVKIEDAGGEGEIVAERVITKDEIRDSLSGTGYKVE